MALQERIQCNPAVYYSFLTPFLVASSLFVDSLLDYHISLANGTLFSAEDNGTLVSCPVLAEHFTVVGGIIPMIAAAAACCGGWLIASSSIGVARTELVFPLSSPVALCFASNSAFSLPVHQGLVVFMSSYIAKGPISLLEVMGCLSHCQNLYHVHQSNALFLVYMLLVFLLAFHMVHSFCCNLLRQP